MSNWQYNMTKGKASVFDWPYQVSYGKENVVHADVLILGGGIAGCHAAINATKRGAKVVVVDKGRTVSTNLKPLHFIHHRT